MPLRIISYDGAAYRAQLNSDMYNAESSTPRERFPVVTLVLYFGYKNRWRKPLDLLNCINVPNELRPFVNNYHINLFEIAWLSDEAVNMFKSDFRIVADYFVQMRKNKRYQPSKDTIVHVHELLQLMSVMTGDSRYEDVCTGAERRPTNMCEAMDAAVNKGIEQAKHTTTINTLKRYIRRNIPIDNQVIEDIAEDNELTIEKVRTIAKENGISISC